MPPILETDGHDVVDYGDDDDDLETENYDPHVTYDAKTVMATHDGWLSDDWRIRTPEEKKRDVEYHRKEARQKREAAREHEEMMANYKPWSPPERRSNWAQPKTRGQSRRDARDAILEEMARRSRFVRVARDQPPSNAKMLRFTEPVKYPPTAACSEGDLSVLLGEDMNTLKKICEGLHPQQKHLLGYISLKDGETGSLKTALGKLQWAHRSRTDAHNTFALYSNNMFRYYRASEDQDESVRTCGIFQCEVMNGTEMMKLPCGHRFAARSLYDLFTVEAATYKRGGSWGCPTCRQGLYQKAGSFMPKRDLYSFKAASGGGVHDLADALVWNLCSRPDQYNEMVARFFANAKKGDGDQAVDDFLESLDTPSGVNQPAAANTAVEVQNNVTMSNADPVETQQPAAVNPSVEVQKDVTMNDADSTEAPASATTPRDVPSDVMEQGVASADVNLDHAADIDLYGMRKLADGGAYALYEMPHCSCIINEPALKKWLDWAVTHVAPEEVPACPVVGCKALLNIPKAAVASPPPSKSTSTPTAFCKGSSIADRLTVSKDAEAVRAAPDQIPPFRPTPIPDRDYIHPDQYIRGHKGGLHTKVSDEKMRELRKLGKEEYLQKMKRIHRQDNKDRKEVWDRDRSAGQPAAKRQKTNQPQ